MAKLDLHHIQEGGILPVETLALPSKALAATALDVTPEDRSDMVFLVKLRLPKLDSILKLSMPADVLPPRTD